MFNHAICNQQGQAGITLFTRPLIFCRRDLQSYSPLALYAIEMAWGQRLFQFPIAQSIDLYIHTLYLQPSSAELKANTVGDIIHHFLVHRKSKFYHKFFLNTLSLPAIFIKLLIVLVATHTSIEWCCDNSFRRPGRA